MAKAKNAKGSARRRVWDWLWQIIVLLILTGAAGIGLFFMTAYRHPWPQRYDGEPEHIWLWRQRRNEPPPELWLQGYPIHDGTKPLRVSWSTFTTLSVFRHHDDVRYIRADLTCNCGR